MITMDQPQERQQGESPIRLTRPFYTVADATYILNYKGERTVRAKLQSGEIKGYKYKGMWRIARADFQKYIDESFGAQ